MANSKNFEKFGLQLDGIKQSLFNDVNQVVKAAALKLFTGVVMKTPVDQGTARASWVIGIGGEAKAAGQVSGGKTQGAPLSGSELEEAGKLGAGGNLLGQKIIISNRLPYILRLEEGYSDQAPSGMVAVTVAEVNKELGAIS